MSGNGCTGLRFRAKKGEYMLPARVDTTGHLQQLRIQKSLDPAHDQEALRICRQMPPRKPAVRQGKRQAQAVTIPILFTKAARQDWGTSEVVY